MSVEITGKQVNLAIWLTAAMQSIAEAGFGAKNATVNRESVNVLQAGDK